MRTNVPGVIDYQIGEERVTYLLDEPVGDSCDPLTLILDVNAMNTGNDLGEVASGVIEKLRGELSISSDGTLRSFLTDFQSGLTATVSSGLDGIENQAGPELMGLDSAIRGLFSALDAGMDVTVYAKEEAGFRQQATMQGVDIAPLRIGLLAPLDKDTQDLLLYAAGSSILQQLQEFSPDFFSAPWIVCKTERIEPNLLENPDERFLTRPELSVIASSFEGWGRGEKISMNDQARVDKIYQHYNTLFLPLPPMLDSTDQRDRFVIVRPPVDDFLETAYLYPSEIGRYRYSHEEMLACLIDYNRSYSVVVTNSVGEGVYTRRGAGGSEVYRIGTN